MSIQPINYVKDFEELDIAMKLHLSGLVIDGKEIEPLYYSPDVDLVTVSKPALIFYRSQPFRDNSRSKTGEIRDNYVYDISNNLIQMDIREAPEPWSITYMVRTMYSYQVDGVKLNSFLFKKFPRGGCLTVGNINYGIEFTSSKLSGAQYKDFGRTEEGKREFSETYNYKLDFLLDMYERRTVKVSSSPVNINLN